MHQVDAIYQNGVFKPLQDVDFHENQRVRLNIQSLDAVDVQSRLADVHSIGDNVVADTDVPLTVAQMAAAFDNLGVPTREKEVELSVDPDDYPLF